MTQDEANLMYAENTWGVYKYRVDYIDVLNDIIKFSDKHPDIVCLDYYPLTEDHNVGRQLFDLDNLIIYLYYHERHIELYNEIHDNDMLENYWYDSDSYDLSDERIKDMHDCTPKTKVLLKKIIELNKEFDKLVYND